jgi:predicted RNA-binding Zn-ribbon protein involved in translation (DUF1610 family)
MNLLEATAHLIDLAKTLGRDDAMTRRAIKRMEKRLEVLRLRAAKALRARRHKAWMRGPSTTQCPHRACEHEITFGDFIKSAVIDGRGKVTEWRCPHCGRWLVPLRPPDEGHCLHEIQEAQENSLVCKACGEVLIP